MLSAYLMENEEEIQREEWKTDAAVVRRFASMAGLRPGMRVIDVCSGAGMSTSILSELAGPTGSAVGIDLSEERNAHATAEYGNERTSFLQKDILRPLEGLGEFDFAWVRFALEYFKAESPFIVKNLASVMRPGGIICLVDLDHNCLNHWGLSPRLEAGLRALIAQLEEVGNFDPYVGRKLYSFLNDLGFEAIGAHVEAHHLIYGPLGPVDEYNWTRKIEVTARNRRVQIPGYETPQDFLDDFLAFFRSPHRFTYTPVIACWGKNPAL